MTIWKDCLLCKKTVIITVTKQNLHRCEVWFHWAPVAEWRQLPPKPPRPLSPPSSRSPTDSSSTQTRRFSQLTFFFIFPSFTFWAQVYQFQTHSHKSRLQWISSLKKAIDNSGEEVKIILQSYLYLHVYHIHPSIHITILFLFLVTSIIAPRSARGTSSVKHCSAEVREKDKYFFQSHHQNIWSNVFEGLRETSILFQSKQYQNIFEGLKETRFLLQP